jgi:histidine ammonia-lyase
MLRRGVTPWVLEEGSVGASGDLVPLAMVGAVLIGLPDAKAYIGDKLMPAVEALHAAELSPIELQAKEGMAITNGSNMIAAIAAIATRDAEKVLKTASIAAALSLEAIRGEKAAFSRRTIQARPHPGAVAVAQSIRDLTEGSNRLGSEAQRQTLNRLPGEERVQDRYSFRAVPPVHGAALEAVGVLRRVVEIEINSATDNPLYFKNDSGDFTAESGANFHGQPLAAVIDHVKAAITALSLISDKRSFSMLDKYQSYGLPAGMASNPDRGETGLMLTQYAGAARAAENRVLSTPSSVMSISTSANQEDFVSMGSIGALHLRKIIENTGTVLGIELLCALRGLQLTQEKLPAEHRLLGKGTSAVFEHLDQQLPMPEGDRHLRVDMERMIGIVRDGSLIPIAGGLAMLGTPIEVTP